MKNKRAILFLFLANTVSGISQGISLIAIPWFISNTLGKPSLYAMMFLTATAISIPWGTFAGTLIDRYDRKKIMLFIQAIGFLIVLSVALVGNIQQKESLPMAMIVYFTTIALYNIHYPNLYAFAQEITEAKHYARITSWLEIQGQTSFAIAGAVAAILLEGKIFSYDFGSWTIYQIFALDATTYAVGLLFLALIRYESLAKRNQKKGSLWLRLKEGFSFLNENRPIWLFGVMSGLVFASTLVTGMYLLPILIKNFLYGSEKVYGFTEASFAVGALFSALFIIRLFSKQKIIIGVLLMQILAAIAFFFMGVNQNILLLYIVYTFLGLFNSGIRILRVTYIFNVIPNEFIGRTNSVFGVINAAIRIGLVALFSLPFFLKENNIRYAMFCLALLILSSVFIMAKNYKKLNLPK